MSCTTQSSEGVFAVCTEVYVGLFGRICILLFLLEWECVFIRMKVLYSLIAVKTLHFNLSGGTPMAEVRDRRSSKRGCVSYPLHY